MLHSLPDDYQPDLLTTQDLRKRLGMPSSTFYRYMHRGAFDHLMVKRPLGFRKYSKALVDEFLAGGSTVQFRQVS